MLNTPASLSRAAVVASFFASTMLASTALHAQAAPASTDAASSTDIVVTAQRRSEPLQNVPISLSALTSAKLTQNNIANFNDFTKLLPSVSFQSTQPGQTTVYMRGIASGGDGNHSGPQPSVGFYLDEQPVTTIGGTLDVHIYDMQRIEALAGPQGTLYGASSESGTIRLLTNKPDTKRFYGAMDGELNSGHHGAMGGKLEGFVNIPLSSNAALRVVGWYQHDAGYIDNTHGTYTFTGSNIKIDNASQVQNNFNPTDLAGGRAALKLDFGKNWTAEAMVWGQDARLHGKYGYNAALGDLQVNSYIPNFSHDRFIDATLTIQGKLSDFDVVYTSGYLQRNIDSQSDYTDYAIQYDQVYTAAGYGGIAGYLSFKDKNGNATNPSQYIIGTDAFTKNFQEIRVSSPNDKPFHFTSGLFYQRQTHNIRQDYKVAGALDPALSVTGDPGAVWLTQQYRTDMDAAAYTDATWDVSKKLTFSGGARVFTFDNSLVGFYGFGYNLATTGANAGTINAAGAHTGEAKCFTTNGQWLQDNPTGTLIPSLFSNAPCNDLGQPVGNSVVPLHRSGSGVTYRFTANYKFDKDKMIYATASSGFRPGGINRRSDVPAYSPDYLYNYELGFKTQWFHRKLRVNGAVFVDRWKQFLFSFLGPNAFTIVQNGPNAQSKGIEFDYSATLAKGLVLSGSGAYVDAHTTSNLCKGVDSSPTCSGMLSNGNADVIVSPIGTQLPVAPVFNMNSSLRYEFYQGKSKMHVQIGWQHASSATGDLRTGYKGLSTNFAAAVGNYHAYNQYDAYFGGDLGRFSYELFVNNLTDERVETSRQFECGASCTNIALSYVRPPRTFGLKLGTKF